MFIPCQECKTILPDDRKVREDFHRDQQQQQQQQLPGRTLEEINEVANLIERAQKIVVLTGAGMSTNSGIPDYRSSADSIWRKHPTVLTRLNQASFVQNPSDFWEAFYYLIEVSLAELVPFPTHDAVIATIRALQPNGGHRFFAWLETNLNKEITIVTQNVDGLHQQAGSKTVISMHGNIFECVCPNCSATYSLLNVIKKEHLPRCECGYVLRPNVVFFGDEVHHYIQAKEEVQPGDLIMVVGTSLKVYPFNQLVYEKRDDAPLVLINGSPVEEKVGFDHRIYGDIEQICRKLQERLA